MRRPETAGGIIIHAALVDALALAVPSLSPAGPVASGRSAALHGRPDPPQRACERGLAVMPTAGVGALSLHLLQRGGPRSGAR